MGQGTFKVVLTGEVIEGFDRGLVVAAVAKLFKCPEPQAERVLQGKATPLKREMDAQTAERYKQQLNKSGIACRLEPVAPAPSILELSLEEDTPANPEPVKNSAPVKVRPAAVPETTSVPNWTLVEDEAKKAAEAEAAAAGFRCPKCNTAQEQGAECVKCGIIFAKYQPVEPIPAVVVEQPGEEAEETDDWDEIVLFVGTDMEKYRAKFHALHQNDGRFQVQWHWAAFLIPVPWMIYRKLYFFAAGYLLLTLLLPPLVWLMLPIAAGLLGNFVYYRYAKWRLGKIVSNGDERREDIISAGGTNSMPVTIGATVAMGFVVSILFFSFFIPKQTAEAMKQGAAQMEELKDASGNPTKIKMLLLKDTLLMQKKNATSIEGHFEMPRDMDGLREVLAIPGSQITDAWGTEIAFESDGENMVFRSAGKDKAFNTDDDIVVESNDK